MQDYIHDYFDYYAKTFVFIQSSRMSKSRLIDVFSKNCLIINFILCKNDDYLPGDTKILQFMLSESLDKVRGSVNKLL